MKAVFSFGQLYNLELQHKQQQQQLESQNTFLFHYITTISVIIDRNDNITMPPKDDQQRLVLQQTASSPTSPASFFLHLQASSNSEGEQQQQQPEEQQQPFLELETAATGTTTATTTNEQPKLPSCRLLPRQLPLEEPAEASPQEVPAFLAFLNKLHSTPEPSEAGSSTASEYGSSDSHSKSEPRHVLFGEDCPQVYPTLRRQEMTSSERHNTWYTDRYLRVSAQMHAVEGDDGDMVHTAGHKQDLILAAARIRRSRQAVMKEQSRTPYLSPGAKRKKEERIREAYHRVTLQCERDAKARGEAAAKEAARIWES